MLTPPKKTSLGSLKKAIFTLHLWLGLACGALFSLVCATGCLLAMHPILETQLNQNLIHLSPASTRAPIGPMLSAAASTTSAPFREVEIPAEADEAWVVRLEGKGPSLYLDPFLGKSLGSLDPRWAESFETLEHLHRWLLLDQKIGRPITGAAALVYLSLLLSGVCLWLSKCYRRPARGLWLKRGVGWKRLAYDAHLVLGVYAIVPLFLMASTGLYWSYRQPYKALVYRVLDGTAPPAAPSKAEEAPVRLDLPYETILTTLAQEQPRPGLIKLAFPKVGANEVRVTKVRQAGFWRLPTRDEWTFDATTGEVLKRQPFLSKTRAEQFLSLIFEIHSGAAWGPVTLGIWVMAVLFGMTLPITGTVMWANRMRAQMRSRQKRPRPDNPRTPLAANGGRVAQSTIRD